MTSNFVIFVDLGREKVIPEKVVIKPKNEEVVKGLCLTIFE